MLSWAQQGATQDYCLMSQVFPSLDTLWPDAFQLAPVPGFQLWGRMLFSQFTRCSRPSLSVWQTLPTQVTQLFWWTYISLCSCSFKHLSVSMWVEAAGERWDTFFLLCFSSSLWQVSTVTLDRYVYTSVREPANSTSALQRSKINLLKQNKK